MPSIPPLTLIFSKILISLVSYESVTDGRTDRRTDGRTDGRTDRPGYSDARTHLKRIHPTKVYKQSRKGMVVVVSCFVVFFVVVVAAIIIDRSLNF